MKKQKKRAHTGKEKIPVTLTSAEIHSLERIVKSGVTNARVITRARVLLLSHRGMTNRVIIETLGCSHELIRAVRTRARDRGSIHEAIYDLPRTGQPKKITPAHEAFVVATACTDAPDGHHHWTIPALRAKLLQTYDELTRISDERIRQMLLRAALKPWREKNVVHPQTHSRFSGAHG